MDDVDALHTAARRYCLTRYGYWTTRYAQLQKGREHRMPYTYTASDMDTFPRYQVLDAILVEVERFVPSDFDSLAEALDLRVAAAESAESGFTRSEEPIENKAMDEEREQVAAYLGCLRSDDLIAIKPLPYRRTLGESEAKELHARLSGAWGVAADCWYPLAETKRSDVEAFQALSFLNDGGGNHLRLLLEERGVERVFALPEGEHHWELELESVEWIYAGEETFWSDQTLDWVVYASHENSITVGGWLLSELQSSWPNWRSRVWRTPFDEWTLRRRALGERVERRSCSDDDTCVVEYHVQRRDLQDHPTGRDALLMLRSGLVRTSLHAPNMSSIAERFVLTVKTECLNELILFGYPHLERCLAEFAGHYNSERPNQGLGNELIHGGGDDCGDVVVRERLGGLLRSYHRAA